MAKIKVNESSAFYKIILTALIIFHNTPTTLSKTPKSCIKKDGSVHNCETNIAMLCTIHRDGSMNGCDVNSVCASGDNSKTLVCDDDPDSQVNICCCGTENCNDMRVKEIRATFCASIPEAKICQGGGEENNSDNKCLNKEESIEKCKLGQVACEIKRGANNKLTPNGCAKGKNSCPLRLGEDFTCHQNKCCCKATETPCNDKNNLKLKGALTNSGGSANQNMGPFALITFVVFLRENLQ